MSVGHVAPKSMYYAVFAALLVGTGLTVAAAHVDMAKHLAPYGSWGAPLGVFANNFVMLLIACTKATLVILFFMHVRWSTRLTWIVAGAGFLWLLILFGLGMSDYVSRGWVTGTLR
jgi:cytochrome c oxidase subunit IV